jgi:uncharacterized protein (TIGR03067 family)
MIGRVGNGIEATPADIKSLDVTAVIRGRECNVSIGALGTSGKLNIQVDPSRRPWRVDVFGYWPKERNRRVYGIYRVTGENLEVTLHSDNRPTDFVSREQDGRLFITLERVRKI